ncbi:MAG: ADOP family duplicated permease [Bryobacteraceae bacterium]
MRVIRSFRNLRKHWKLSVIAVFSLSVAMALGIVSLSVSNTFVLLPPPAPDPDRLVMIYSRSASEAIGQISYPDYQYFRENNHVFSDIAAAPNSISVNEDKNFEKREVKVVSRPVSGNYLTVMGIPPFMGRLLSPEDERNKTPVAVMTYSCWTRLGSDPNIIGKVLASNTIIGVLPKEFAGAIYGVNGDLLVPLSESNYSAASRGQRDSRRLVLTARLKPGIGKPQAQAEISALAGQLATAYPADDKDRTAVVTRATLLPPESIPTAELVTGILMAVVLLVLLIACANVANLLLAVAVGRRQEAAIKLALGASRRRLIGEFLKESAILCAASAALGYVIAAVAIARFSSFNMMLPEVGSFSFGLHLRLDATVAIFTIALMGIAILATGLAPALYASSPALAQVLSGELAVGGTRKNVRRNILVILQVAICTLVLIGMGLCQRSLYNLRHSDPGFAARNLVAAQIYLAGETYSEARGKEFYGVLRRQVSALPGVESVALSSDLPLLGSSVERVQFPDGGKQTGVGHSVVDSDYFGTMGIGVLAGRVFDSRDREGGPEAVVINRKMADTFWPGRDAVGQAITVEEPTRKAIVVGIVKDGKYDDVDEAPQPFMYYALSQHYIGGFNIIVRTAGDPHLWVAPLTQTLRALDLPVLEPVTFDGWMNFSLVTQRITAGCVAGLSALGLLLAVIGLFGAISYSVSERRKELGIRVALGARPGQLMKMVLRQTLMVAGTGIVIGVLLGVGATMVLRSQFYEIGAVEWTVLAPVSAAMLAVALLVAYLSAKPWITINPMEAVRHA